MYNGMKKRDRQAHFDQLKLRWEYWEKMPEEALRTEYLNGKLKGDVKKDKEVATRVNGFERSELIRRLVLRHVEAMVN